jgi:hypothetical protein
MPTNTGAELQPRTKDGMDSLYKSDTNLPVHTCKKTTIRHSASARSSARKSAHEIHPILILTSVALDSISIKLQPWYRLAAKARCLCVPTAAAAALGVSVEPWAIDVTLQG